MPLRSAGHSRYDGKCWGSYNMQGAKSLGRKQITSCHWNIPTFEYRVNKEEGVYVLMLACLKIEELLMLFAFSPQGPLLMSVLRQLSNRHVERLQLFMEKHYLNEWKLSDFSREFGMGLTTFKELFGSVYGVSPRAWISERRILYAHQLLLNSDMSIVDIAMEAGFSSQSYFTQSYRRRFGCTPSRSRQGKDECRAKNN